MLPNKLPVMVRGLLALCLCAGTTATTRSAEKPADPKTPSARLDALWNDLASADQAKATRAALTLVASKEAVPFLKERLRPVKPDAKRLAQLLEQLDSEEFEKREAASAELDYLGKFIKKDLETALRDKSSAEVKQRIQTLLDRIASESGKAEAPPALAGGVRSVSASTVNGKTTILINGKELKMTPLPAPTPRLAWHRAERAAAVLEHIGTPEAKALLESLAGGEAEAPPTKAAKEALERLKK